MLVLVLVVASPILARSQMPAQETPYEGIYYKLNALKQEMLRQVVIDLAQSSPPVELRLVPNETLEEALGRHCVGPTQGYVDLARAMLLPLNDRRLASPTAINMLSNGLPNPEPYLTIKVPFCIRIPFEQVGVEQSDTAQSLFQKALGAQRNADSVSPKAVQDWLWRFFLANASLDRQSAATYEALRDNGMLFADSVQAPRDSAIAALINSSKDKTVVIPTGTIETVEVFAPADARQVSRIKDILARLGPIVTDIKDLGDGSWGRLVAQERHLSSVADCGAAPPGAAREEQIAGVDERAVRRVLDLNDRVRKKAWDAGKAGSPTVSPTIVVADNGLLDRSVPPFSRIVWNAPYNPPDRRSRLFNHGTLVASVAIGGPSLAFDLARGSYPLYVLVQNIEASGFVDLHAFNKMTINAKDGVIVNLSVRFPQPLDLFRQLARVQKATDLFVVAAGNIPKIGWPAGYGGGDTGNIITVAALAPWGAIAQGTYRGSEFVDIGALGCDVPVLDLSERPPASSTVPPGKLDKAYVSSLASGTSLAAPQVSFVAALIKREHSLLSAEQIRRRILVTADIYPHLEKDIRDGRVLNAANALSLFLDVVQRKSNGEPLFGKVTLPSERMEMRQGVGGPVQVPVVNLCGKDRTVTSIRRIALRKESKDEKKFLIYFENDRVPEPAGEKLGLDFCRNLAGRVRIEEFGGAVHDFEFNDISDVVLAERFDR
jgi:subtilisin family serine protease